MTIFEDALQLIDELSVEDLRSLTKEQLMDIVSLLTPEEASNFIFAKNIKIFGGINGYVNDFFEKNTISKIKTMTNGVSKVRTISSTIDLLNKMLKPDLTEENRSRINSAIAELREPSTAPAAGGYRKSKKSKNKKSKSRKVKYRI